MGADMMLRDLYLPADTPVDQDTARTVIDDLCKNAILDDLGLLLDEEWIHHPTVSSGATDQELAPHAADLRDIARRVLHLRLTAFAASLTGRQVTRFRPSNDHPAVDAYVTGGLSWGDSPTDAFDAWDLVFDTDRLPDGWADRIGTACGLLHPRGDGPATAHTITLHTWAAPPTPATGLTTPAP